MCGSRCKRMAQLFPPLFLISGTPGSGKTTAAQVVDAAFPVRPARSRSMICGSGSCRASRTPCRSSPRRPAVSFAWRAPRRLRSPALYADAGFAVAIDDVVHEPDAEAFLSAPLAPRTVYKVLLQPPLEVALARNAERDQQGISIHRCWSMRSAAITVRWARQNHADLGWIVIDNGELNVEQTVDAILESTLQDIINFRRLSDRLITGGQPTEEELALAAAAGAEVVINLGRLDPAYALPDEHGTVAALGLIYEHIPVVWAEPTAADLEALLRRAGAPRGTPPVRPLRGQLSRLGVHHALSRASAGLADRGRAARHGRHLGSGRVSAMAGIHRDARLGGQERVVMAEKRCPEFRRSRGSLARRGCPRPPRGKPPRLE